MPDSKPDLSILSMSFEEFTVQFKGYVQELSEVSERFLNFIEPVKIKPVELTRDRLGNFIRDLNDLLRKVNEHSSSQFS